MTRVAPVKWKSNPEYSGLVDLVKRRRSRMGQLYPVLMYSPPLLDGVLTCGSAIQQTSLDPALREMIIVLVGELNGSLYGSWRHQQVAARHGVDVEKMIDLQDHAFDTARFTARERAALVYAKAISVDVTVEQTIFDQVKEHFTDQEIVEITVTAGYFNMISRVLVALEIGEQPDPDDE